MLKILGGVSNWYLDIMQQVIWPVIQLTESSAE